MTDQQRHALRWVLLQAIGIRGGQDLSESETSTERADLESLIALAHPDDRPELEAALSESDD